MPGQLNPAPALVAPASAGAGASRSHGSAQTRKLTTVSPSAMPSSRPDG